MEEADERDLHLLPRHFSSTPDVLFRSPESAVVFRSPNDGLSLDLQLSISRRPTPASSVESLKWDAAEQTRLAAVEKAYAERVRELTRREMELAQSEFALARLVWERAKKLDSSRMEITCQSCKRSLF